MVSRIFYALAWCFLIVRCDLQLSDDSKAIDGPASLSVPAETLLDPLDREEDPSNIGSQQTLFTEIDQDLLDEKEILLNNGSGQTIFAEIDLDLLDDEEYLLNNGPKQTIYMDIDLDFSEEDEDLSNKDSEENLTGEEDLSNKGTEQYPSGPVVTSKCGTYQGAYMGAGKGIKYEQYLGIAYAQPPIGSLRFQKAMPYSGCNANKLFQATQFGSPCMQIEKKALETSRMKPSENCLFLNIFRPANCKKTDRKAVLVYLYESYFLYGSAAQTELNGGVLAALADAIIVTLNYRLGAFGWLSGAVDDIVGNAGISDVIEALNWICANIEDFGGDPNLVTIGGHGAGATIALFLAFNYQIPKGLFQGVMIMSPDVNPQSFVDSSFIALLKSNEVLKLVGCLEGSKTDDFSESEVKCVKKVEAKTLAEASVKISFYDGNGICSRAQLMVRYRRMSLDHRLHRGIFRKGMYIYLGAVDTEFKRSLIGSTVRSEEEAAHVMVNNIQPIIVDQRPVNIRGIVDHYLGVIHGYNLFKVGQRTALALNNLCFGCPVNELVSYLSRYNKVYAYQYSYVASCNRDSPKRIYGPYHGDDVLFGFGEPLRDLKKYNDYDRDVSRLLIDIWSDFLYQREMRWPCFDYKDRYVGMIEGLENYFIQSPYTDICEKLDV